MKKKNPWRLSRSLFSLVTQTLHEPRTTKTHQVLSRRPLHPPRILANPESSPFCLQHPASPTPSSISWRTHHHRSIPASFSVLLHGSLRCTHTEGDSAPRIVAAHSSWVDSYLPAPARPFALLARLDKPIGTWLLFWPSAWSIALAAPTANLPDFETLALFGVGAILLRGAGCTINDLLDRDIDQKVERTKLRPIASGAVTPFQGLCFLGFQLLLGLGILLQLNQFSQILGASSLLFVGTYPLFKRWTYWPQAFLGLTLNWGALLGWATVRGSIEIPVIAPLYVAGICWTLVYDTIYAHQDKDDDVKVGVKSTALYFGDQTKSWLGIFGTVTISSLILAGGIDNLGWAFYSSMFGAAAHLYWQISSVSLHDRADCNSKFVSNKWFGAIVFGGIIGGKLFP